MDAWSGEPIPAQYLKGRTALERQGALVFQAKQCHNCHALGGAGGERGPELDRVAVAADAGSTHPPGDPGRRQHAGLRKELESRGDDCARGVSRDAAPGRTNTGPRCFTRRAAVTLLLVALAATYLRGWYRLWKTLPNLISIWRLTAFVGGIVSLWLAIESPLAEWDEQLLTAHMVQHLLLMIVAAPLILLGAPSITLLHGLPRPFVREALGPLMRARVVHRLGQICARPALCWLAASLVVLGWHVPAAFDLALRSHGWHEIEHTCFLTAGLLFWWPVIRPWPSLAGLPHWSVPLYLLLGYAPVRCALGISHVFGSRGVSVLPVGRWRAQSISSSRPSTRRSADVGDGDVCLPHSGAHGDTSNLVAAAESGIRCGRCGSSRC